jgi:hypothetical protein
VILLFLACNGAPDDTDTRPACEGGGDPSLLVGAVDGDTFVALGARATGHCSCPRVHSTYGRSGPLQSYLRRRAFRPRKTPVASCLRP